MKLAKIKYAPAYLTQNNILPELNAAHVYNRDQIEWFTKFSRFGFFDLYDYNSVTREYIFFSKMDLHLFQSSTKLNSELVSIPFFTNCFNTHRDTMYQLQWSIRSETGNSPFCNLLSNAVTNKIDLSDISIEKIETSTNIYGNRIAYPLPTTTSNNVYEFSLEFEDTKYLDVYMFFRIWYEYELLKQKGQVTPPDESYILNKVVHDQMSAYKITVGEDMETIIHWAKFWGVYPTTIPRSTFSELQDGPIKFAVEFMSQWVEDMDPNILSDFNALVAGKKNQYSKDIPIYNNNIGKVNGTWCNVPYITSSTSHGRPIYKLKWR